jgi:RNA polymerase sigma-70 factor, ECF subfamily
VIVIAAIRHRHRDDRVTRLPDLQKLPDAELVAAACAGDGDAFNAIMKRYNQRLYRVARAIVRDDGEAEDVLQEAYLRAFTALPKFRGEASLATWLTRITLNEALGSVRRRRSGAGTLASMSGQ